MAVVYLLPRGVIGFVDDMRRLKKRFRIVLVEDEGALGKERAS
jgi:hypothetical protein